MAPLLLKPRSSPQEVHKVKPASTSGRGRLIALIGLPGMGKTSLAAQFPKPYFVIDPKESGVIDLQESGQIDSDIQWWQADKFSDLIRFNQDILNGSSTIPSDVKTLVYESISGFEQQAMDFCCAMQFGSNWGDTAGGFNFYQKGDRITAENYWNQLSMQFVALRNMGYNVLVTGHSEVKNVKNHKGADYLCETCRCNGPTWAVTDYYFENIFFLSFEVQVEKENKFARAKALTQTNRFLWGFKTPYQAAKNRCRIDSLINTEPVNADEGPEKTFINMCHACNWDRNTLRYL